MATQTVLPLRILTCQTDGALSPSVPENVARWRSTLHSTELTKSDKIDVVHFPETAFCRYYYRDRSDLEAYGGAEEAGKGAVFAFGSEMAVFFEAYVIVGYAERVLFGGGGDQVVSGGEDQDRGGSVGGAVGV